MTRPLPTRGNGDKQRNPAERHYDAAFAPDNSNGDSLARQQAAIGSANLLRALLRYGLRNDRHLGLGAGMFAQRCRETGLMCL